MCVYYSLGLILTLNIDQDDYIKAAGQTAGVQITVLSQNIMPFPEDTGITLSPGYVASIELAPVSTMHYLT